MAIVDVFVSSDFFVDDPAFLGTTTIANAQLIRIENGLGDINDYRGAFQYDAAGSLVGGTVSEIQAYARFALTLNVREVDTPVLSVQAAVLGGGFFNLIVEVLRSDDIITGSIQPDRIAGFGGDDAINAGGGNDTAFGGQGHDLIRGAAGNDEIYGETGNDRMFGGAGIDFLRGGGGRDKVNGGAGSDTVIGDKGRDIVMGGAGRDLVIGGRGDDTLSGGSGRDLFVFTRGDGEDTITDFQAGFDQIEIVKGAARFAQLDFRRKGDDVVVSFANVEIEVEDIALRVLRDADNFLF